MQCLITRSVIDFCSANVSIKEMSKDMDLYRLPETVKPLSYDLTLHLSTSNLKTGNFSGDVRVKIKASEDVPELLLHTNGLDIEDVQVNGAKSSFTIDQDHQLIKIQSAHKKGSGEISVKFSGSMLGKLVGLYTSKYKKPDGDMRSIATTKFEPTYARQAFPCFDEPNLKANFSIHIIKPKDSDYIALSNMPVKSETEVENGIRVSFEESVKMPTYLACWVVSDFKSRNDVITSPNFADIPYRVFATPAQLAKTEYAAFVGKKVMEFYLDYFQIPFPLPKLDMLAIPDYSSGATEHWGIVTYRETSLLFDKNISSSVNQRRVATVVAHELAHSWFGNLVTMDWWNDIWLNEGFASYIEYKGVDAAHPDWKMLDQFVLDDLHNVLKLDATLASHPIVQQATTPDEITSLFDTISYSKGASILRMMENSISNETFQQGVTNYLKKYAFSNAVTQNLLDEFQNLVADNLNLTEYLNTWTVQMGFPILNVVKTEDGYFRLTQKRFLTDPNAVDNATTPFKYKWTIPVTYFTDEDPVEKLAWFNHADSHVDINATGKFVKFNSRQVGYYRVNYEPEVWNTLIENINELSIADRAHLLEETFRIAEASQISYDIPLNLSKYMREEMEYLPWAVAQTMLTELKTYLLSSKSFTDYKQYVIDLVMPAVNNYSWNETEEDNHLTRLVRSKVLALACSMEEQSCLEEARSRLQKYLYEGVKPSPDLKDLVYKYGMVNGNKQDWEKLWNKFTDETDAGEKLSLLAGLAAIKDESLIHRLLDLAKDDTYIRKQDYPSAISYMSNNPVGTQIVWIYFRENWNVLVDRFGLNDRYLHNMIPAITAKFTTNTQKEELLAFYVANPEAGSGAAARKRALETVNNNINWLRRNKESVESWIENNKH
ncbi:glutamyl aminopeptidase-like isoform X3 [Atheta coriaria]|uniref:glutamyl aminopeptidase-like isoform X3 n=1 Tax=Dalotia coriaria TaxID=877792 RepID=UPI0031F43A87